MLKMHFLVIYVTTIRRKRSKKGRPSGGVTVHIRKIYKGYTTEYKGVLINDIELADSIFLKLSNGGTSEVIVIAFVYIPPERSVFHTISDNQTDMVSQL